jgi:RES domain-containing protein
MRLKANSRYHDFKTWCIRKLPSASPLNLHVYRVAGPRHTSANNIISGIGGWKANGRWCTRQKTKLLYLSETPQTAMSESNEHAWHNNLPLWNQMPKITVAIDLKARSIIDLTDPAVAIDLPVPLAILMAEDWRTLNDRGQESMTQSLGRAALVAGMDGLRVPSKPDPNGVNIVIFRRGGSNSGTTVTLLNPDALKALGKN